MERRVTIATIGAVILFLGVTSCDKVERKTKKFIKEGPWVMDSLMAGNNEIDDLPNWYIAPCAGDQDYCFGAWDHKNGSSSNFFWKFSNMGGNFELIADTNSIQTTMAYAQCLNFSGEYKVKKSKRNTFHFESVSTIGYPGTLVTIIVSTKD